MPGLKTTLEISTARGLWWEGFTALGFGASRQLETFVFYTDFYMLQLLFDFVFCGHVKPMCFVSLLTKGSKGLPKVFDNRGKCTPKLETQRSHHSH